MVHAVRRGTSHIPRLSLATLERRRRAAVVMLLRTLASSRLLMRSLKSVRRMLIPRRGRAPDDALAARASAAPAPSSRALVRGGSSS